jgi:phosphomannomutase
MTTPLMISVAGIRGIVGDSLTPPVVARFAAAFAQELGPGPIVVGRDARTTGPMVLRAALAGLNAAGRDVVDIGLATTPATQLAVEHLKAAGGLILTASHNPAPWNALKFLSSRGEFLDAETGGKVRARYEADASLYVPWDRVGSVREEQGSLAWHLERVLGLDVIDVNAIRARKLKIAVDGCRSAGGVALPKLIEALGGTPVLLDCEPDGRFTRELEPLPEHLGALGETVRKSGADFGVAADPDADRAAFVDHEGVPLGEEYTVVLGTDEVLRKHRGPIVTNLSTTRMLEDVAKRHGVTLHRTPVGEAHVVGAMRAHGAIAGGEGNGGMILPAAHYGRDSLVAVALIAQSLARTGEPLRALTRTLPAYHMVKEKVARPDTPWEVQADRLRRDFQGWALDTADGLRFSRDEEWLHVRASGTEPVVRLIAETPTAPRTRSVIEDARRSLLSATGPVPAS